MGHAVAGDDEILKAVVVVIADGDAVAVEGVIDNPRLCRHRAECPAVTAPEQLAGKTGDPLVGGYSTAAGGDEIEPPVAIEVEPPHAATEGFEDRELIRLTPIAVRGLDPQGGSPLDEVHRPSGGGRQSGRGLVIRRRLGRPGRRSLVTTATSREHDADHDRRCEPCPTGDSAGAPLGADSRDHAHGAGLFISGPCSWAASLPVSTVVPGRGASPAARRCVAARSRSPREA